MIDDVSFAEVAMSPFSARPPQALRRRATSACQPVARASFGVAGLALLGLLMLPVAVGLAQGPRIAPPRATARAQGRVQVQPRQPDETSPAAPKPGDKPVPDGAARAALRSAIGKLEAEDAKTVEAAEKELLALAAKYNIVRDLRQVANGASLEAAWRARRVLQKLGEPIDPTRVPETHATPPKPRQIPPEALGRYLSAPAQIGLAAKPAVGQYVTYATGDGDKAPRETWALVGQETRVLTPGKPAVKVWLVEHRFTFLDAVVVLVAVEPGTGTVKAAWAAHQGDPIGRTIPIGTTKLVRRPISPQAPLVPLKNAAGEFTVAWQRYTLTRPGVLGPVRLPVTDAVSGAVPFSGVVRRRQRDTGATLLELVAHGTDATATVHPPKPAATPGNGRPDGPGDDGGASPPGGESRAPRASGSGR